MGISLNGRPFSSSRTSNWVAREGGLPVYIRRVARGIMRKKGVPEGVAIPLAIGVVRDWATGKRDVDADTRAKALAAYTEFRSKGASSRAKTAAKRGLRL